MSSTTATDLYSQQCCPNSNASNATCHGTQIKYAMCLVNDLARSMGIKQEYHLISESGPSHQRVYEVSLQIESFGTFSGKGSSIKKAQQDAAGNALQNDRINNALNSIENRKKYNKKNNKSTSPAVELNVLAMRKGESVTFTVTDMSTALEVENSLALATKGKTVSNPSKMPTYLACAAVFGCEFTGTGKSPQGARHAAAEKALIYYRSNNLHGNNCEPSSKNDATTSEVEVASSNPNNKSPISLLHEYATKNDLSMSFEVVSESGPDHIPSFLTRCTLGEHTVQASGTSKKTSRRNAAEKMLHLLHSLESLNLNDTKLNDDQQTSIGSGEANAAAGDVDTGFSSEDSHALTDEEEDEEEVFIEVRRGKKRNQQQHKLVTQDQDQCQYDHSGQFGGGDGQTTPKASSESKTVETGDEEEGREEEKGEEVDDEDDEDTASTSTNLTCESKACVTVLDPVQRLNQYCASYKGDVPKYRLIYERYVNQKRREFVMECTAKMPGPKGEIAYVVGIDSNSKMAKKRAAENMMKLLTTGKAIDEVKIPPKSNLAPILKDTTHCANQNTEQEQENEVRSDRPRRQRQVSFSDSHNPRHKRGKKDTC